MYNVGPTSSTLVQHCTNIIQMFFVFTGNGLTLIVYFSRVQEMMILCYIRVDIKGVPSSTSESMIAVVVASSIPTSTNQCLYLSGMSFYCRVKAVDSGTTSSQHTLSLWYQGKFYQFSLWFVICIILMQSQKAVSLTLQVNIYCLLTLLSDDQLRYHVLYWIALWLGTFIYLRRSSLSCNKKPDD